jgi:hypothetical protein
MTEAEWLAGEDPMALLKAARYRFRHRKTRLFAVACCRLIWHLLTDQRSREAVEVAERYADGRASDEDLHRAAVAALAAHEEAFKAKGKEGACGEWAAPHAADPFAFRAATNASWMAAVAAQGLRHVQADLVRDIVGNPFRPAKLNWSWLTPDALALARTIYDDRAFDRLPILADALEEAGCTDADLLAHCRGLGPHARGCWAVDLLLGRG